MEKQLLQSRDVEDVKVTPPKEEGASEVTVSKAEELAEHELTLIEHGRELLKVASKAAKSDKLDQDARGQEAMKTVLPAAISSAIEVGFGNFGIEAISGYINLPILMGAGALSIMHLRPTNDRSLSLPEGNMIQCLRIAQHTDTIREGKVLLAVHPRGFTGEDAVEQARRSMADALEVISLAHADAKDKNQFGGVVVGAAAAKRAGLHILARHSYKEVIQDITEEPAHVPYDENALVLPMDGVKEIAERLRQNPSTTMGRTLDELARRHSGVKEALVADNPAILSTLHTVLQRLAYSEGRQSQWEKEVQKVGDLTVWTGNRYKVVEDIVPTIENHDPYNPILTYRSAQTGEERSRQNLRSATGGELDTTTIMRLLDEGNIDDMKLVRIALQLIEEKHSTEGSESAEAIGGGIDDDSSDTTENSQDPLLITLGKDIDKWKHRRRELFKLALGSAAVFTAAQSLAWGVATFDAKADSRDGTVEVVSKSSLFQIENHDLPQKDPHWAWETNYVFKNGEWTAVKQDQKELDLPRTLAKEQPHLTVKTTMTDEDLSLPIEEDTRLASVRVYDKNKTPIEVKTYQKTDGVVLVDGNKKTRGTYLEYDLVAGNGSSIHADRPVTVEGDMYYNDVWEKTFDDAAAGSKYVRENFIYDASQSQMDKLGRTHSPSEYADHLFDTGRCQCEQCNTQVALMESQVRPDQKLALVTGFLHARKPDETHSYLVETHAWLNNGETIDATATKKDKASVVPVYEDTTTIDKKWDKQVEKPLKKAEREHDVKQTTLWSLVGLAGLGLARLEMRQGSLRRTVRTYRDLDGRAAAAGNIHPADARQLMGWQAYGAREGRVPEIGESSNRDKAPKEENIPISTLQEIAKGGYAASNQLTKKQQRGLRRTAAVMLRARKNQKKGRE